MNRLAMKSLSEVPPATAQLFNTIKKMAGIVPNAYAVIGSNSPVALEAMLNLEGALKKTQLSAKEIEVIKLAVSQAVDCDYCLAAHTMIGKKLGFSRESILGIRHGNSSGESRYDALADFVRHLVTARGTVPLEVLKAVQAAGYHDTHIVEIALVVASISFTNLINRINDTVLDFPAAD